MKRHFLFIFCCTTFVLYCMEHPEEIALISKTKSNNVAFDLIHFPARERNVFTWKPLIESMRETKKVVQVIAVDVRRNSHVVSYYPENEFVQWYFKKKSVDHLSTDAVDLDSQKTIVSFALYNYDASNHVLKKYYDSTSAKSPVVKCCISALIVGHVLLYSALCYCVTKVLTKGF